MNPSSGHLSPDLAEDDQLEINKQGLVRMDMKVAADLTNMLTVQVYTEFENVNEIECIRNSVYDFDNCKTNVMENKRFLKAAICYKVCQVSTCCHRPMYVHMQHRLVEQIRKRTNCLMRRRFELRISFRSFRAANQRRFPTLHEGMG